MGKSLVIKGADFSAVAIEKEYEIVNWVKPSSAKQCISTGITRTNNMRVEVEFSLDESFVEFNTPGTFWFSKSLAYSEDYTGAVAFCVLKVADKQSPDFNNIGAMFGKNEFYWVNNCAVNDSNTHVISVDSSTITLDGASSRHTESPDVNHGTIDHIVIMGQKNENNGSQYVKIHSFKIYNGGILTNHYVPVKKKDETVCMLDKINGVYLYTDDGNNPLFK